MKNKKFYFLSFVCVALLFMTFAFTAKIFATTFYNFNKTFVMGTFDSSPISNAANWDVVGSISCPSPTDKLCATSVTNVPGQSMPSEQVIIDHIRGQYDANGKTLSNNEVVEIFVSGLKVAEAVVKLKS
jgi:hypothetical protein